MRYVLVISVVFRCIVSSQGSLGDELNLSLRREVETSRGSGRFHRRVHTEKWQAKQTAIIVCDVWDLHHSQNAVRRVTEFAPRLDAFLKKGRTLGATIIHSPSDCMEAYKKHVARRRAIDTPQAANLPDDIRSWCSRIPQEEHTVYPLDQSDGGDDDDPTEHVAWAAKLKAMGRNPGIPWKTQSDLITIDEQRDYISDRGDEVWNILESRGIKNVILTGVHTNMCVLGRPFGLRQMKRNGKKVVLVRDLTDTMYNPARWPYVSHFTGNDLIASHIERFVCPTITSDQLLGGKPFRFHADTRPNVAILMAEDEYETNRTLPQFARQFLGKNFRVTLIFGSDTELNDIPGLDDVRQADVLVVSVRRRVLPKNQLAIIRRHVSKGKAVVGIRTASHAFSLRNQKPPQGNVAWPEFDAEVFGGHYTGHFGNKLRSTVSIAKAAAKNPILAGLPNDAFPQAGSLYKTSPVAKNSTVLLEGRLAGKPAEPVAWTYVRRDGGRSFYTSMGHAGDFESVHFLRLLLQAIHWAAEKKVPQELVVATKADDYRAHWSLIAVPSTWQAATSGVVESYNGPAWYRCSIRLRDRWIDDKAVMFELPVNGSQATVWFNGKELQRRPDRKRGSRYLIPQDGIEVNDANLLVVRIDKGKGDRGWAVAPRIYSGDRRMELKGRWHFRIGDDKGWSNIPLPARYGTSTDILFEPQ